jgi:anti-sigma B factor antagonist
VDLVPSAQRARSVAELLAAEQVTIEARTNRRTALVALRGELDLVTVSKVAEVLDGLQPQADGVRHVVLDLRALTFMELTGLHELIRQNEFARTNRHNLAVVRGTDAIQRVLELTGVEEMLVLVDDPDDVCAATRHALTCGGGHRRSVCRCCVEARAALLQPGETRSAADGRRRGKLGGRSCWADQAPVPDIEPSPSAEAAA